MLHVCNIVTKFCCCLKTPWACKHALASSHPDKKKLKRGKTTGGKELVHIQSE